MTLSKTLMLGLTLTLAVGTIFSAGVAPKKWGKVSPRLRNRTAVAQVRPAPKQEPATCKAFSAIAEAVLPTANPIGENDVWGGPLYGMLGGEFLGTKAVLSGNDGEDTWYEEETLGTGKGGSYTVCMDYPTCADSFTYEIPFAVFPAPPNDLGMYIGYTISIVKGTGKFAGATGNLNVRGPFIAWPDDNPIGVAGRWHGELSGSICGIQ